MSSGDDNTEALELSDAAGMRNGATALENTLGVSYQEVNRTPAMWPSSPAPRYLQKRSVSIGPHKDRARLFLVAFFAIARAWKGVSGPATGNWINKWRFVHTMEYHSVGRRNELLICTATWVTRHNDDVREKPGLGIDAGWGSGRWGLWRGPPHLERRPQSSSVPRGSCAPTPRSLSFYCPLRFISTAAPRPRPGFRDPPAMLPTPGCLLGLGPCCPRSKHGPGSLPMSPPQRGLPDHFSDRKASRTLFWSCLVPYFLFSTYFHLIKLYLHIYKQNQKSYVHLHTKKTPQYLC